MKHPPFFTKLNAKCEAMRTNVSRETFRCAFAASVRPIEADSQDGAQRSGHSDGALAARFPLRRVYFSASATLRAAAVMERSSTSTVISA